MKIGKRLVLLVVLLAVWRVSTEIVLADNECHQNCSHNYSSCVVQANDDRNMCYTQAEWAYEGCLISAGVSASGCGENCYADCFGGGMACSPSDLNQCYMGCGEEYSDQTEACAQDYYSSTASCNVTQDNALELCDAAYNVCFSNCPPTP